MTVTTTPTEIKVKFPEFVSLDDAFIQIMINDALLMVNQTAWISKSKTAIEYMTAHLLELSSRAGNAGVVACEKVGDLSRSYSVASAEAGSGSLGETSYGKFFLSMRKTIPKGPIIW